MRRKHITDPTIVGIADQTAGGSGTLTVTGGGAPRMAAGPTGRKVLIQASPPAIICEPSSVLSATKAWICDRPPISKSVAFVFTRNVNELSNGAMRDDAESKSKVTSEPSLLRSASVGAVSPGLAV